MTRVGVIGVGGMGFTHVKALKSLAEEMDLQVVAIADLQEKYQKRAKEEWPEAAIYAEGAERTDDGFRHGRLRHCCRSI